MSTTIARVERWVLRAPIANPVANAFGAMTNRPAVFVRITASDGAWGWGEVFSNFPQVGAEHRGRLIESIFAPLVTGCADDPATVRTLLERRTRQMAIQCGEPGPFAQISGGIDQALWDMAARRAGLTAIVCVGDVPLASTSVNGTPSLLRAAAHAAVVTSVGPCPISSTLRLSVGGVAAAAPVAFIASATTATATRTSNHV